VRAAGSIHTAGLPSAQPSPPGRGARREPWHDSTKLCRTLKQYLLLDLALNGRLGYAPRGCRPSWRKGACAMRCPRCHTENKAGRKFCAACGQALALACRTCGFVNNPEDRFCGGCGQVLTAIPPPELTSPPSSTTRPDAQPAPPAVSSPITPHPPDAERRQLTVMFCDLAGSTLSPNSSTRGPARGRAGLPADVCRRNPTL
jgi:hypothetical protein